MSIVLAIDTASHQQIAVALAADGGAPQAVQVDAPQDHTHRLLPLIESLAAGRIRELEQVVVVRGPGSFAGLRVGIAVARGLALATGARAAGVPTLEAVAAAAGGTAIAIHPIGRDEYALQEFEAGIATGEPRAVASSDISPGPRLVGEGAAALGGREVTARERCLAALRIAELSGAAAPSDAIYLRDPRITPARRNLPRPA